jgi:hypothetical protein
MGLPKVDEVERIAGLAVDTNAIEGNKLPIPVPFTTIGDDELP